MTRKPHEGLAALRQALAGSSGCTSIRVAGADVNRYFFKHG